MELADYFKALGDETRLRIINLLLHFQTLRVMDLVSVLKLPQSTISRHLSFLKHSGWVEDRRVDKWVYYRLHHKMIPELRQALLKLFDGSVLLQNDVKNTNI